MVRRLVNTSTIISRPCIKKISIIGPRICNILSIYIIGMSFDPKLSALELKNEGMQIIDRIAITTNNKNKKRITQKKQANTKILCNLLTKLQTGQLWADELYSWKNLPMYSYNQKNK